MPGTRWTPEQIAYLRHNYGRISLERIAADIGRSYRQTRERAVMLKLKPYRERRTVPPGARLAFYRLVEGLVEGRLEF